MFIKVLKAFNGDSILVSYIHDGETKNILIDTGTPATYYSEDTGDGELKEIIQNIKNRNQKIDLLIITHWDNDHIGGVLKWFEDDLETAKLLIKKIWFNSGTLINKYFNDDRATEDSNIINSGSYSPNTSIRQGINFEKYILENNFSNTEIIKSLVTIPNLLEGSKFIILSPTNFNLEKLLCEWKDSPYNPNTSAPTDYNKSFQELLLNKFKEDKRIHNGSSIAFILEVENKRLLFLGDAHPSVVVGSLIRLEQKKQKIDYVKVSHHASKANTSDELLDLIDCENYIISSDGKFHGLPNKETIVRIINKNDFSNIFFNYPELIEKIFTDYELNGEKFNCQEISEINI